MLCFRKILAAKKFMDKRAGGREYQKFPSKFFCLTVPKNFVGEPFSVSLIRVSKNFMLQRVMSRFSVENFLCHSTEPFHRGTLLCCVSENFWQRKSLWIKGREGFPSKKFCLTVEKIRKGTL